MRLKDTRDKECDLGNLYNARREIVFRGPRLLQSGSFNGFMFIKNGLRAFS